MSLLIKALEQAAKDRKAGRSGTNAANPAVEPAPAQAAAAGTAPGPAPPSGQVEPTLEPTLDPPPQRRAPPRAPAPRPAAANIPSSPSPSSSPALTLDSPAAAPRRAPSSLASLAASDAQQQQQRARAATVMQAGGGSSHIIAWLRANPVAMVGTAAALFALAFGIYVYLQIAAPGVFVRQASSPPQAPPPAPPSAAPMTGIPEAPVPPAITASETERVLAPPGTQPVGPAASSGSIAPSAPAAPSGPLSSASIIGAAPQPATPRGAYEGASEVRRERGSIRPTEGADAPSPVSASPAVRSRSRVAAESDPGAGRERITVSASAVQPRLNPTLSQAYTQLQAGNVDQARASYNTLLQAEPLNTDAMLGLAYIATQENRTDEATQLYLRILQLNPRHATAQGALIGLMGRADPGASESRLKQLIAREPSPFLHFILGNVYADQSQWPQAQQAYFQAHHLEPENPDYAYNLAVGLDHMRQAKPALSFYRRAEQLASAQGRSNFNVSHARERIRALSAQLE